MDSPRGRGGVCVGAGAISLPPWETARARPAAPSIVSRRATSSATSSSASATPTVRASGGSCRIRCFPGRGYDRCVQLVPRPGRGRRAFGGGSGWATCRGPPRRSCGLSTCCASSPGRRDHSRGTYRACGPCSDQRPRRRPRRVSSCCGSTRRCEGALATSDADDPPLAPSNRSYAFQVVAFALGCRTAIPSSASRRAIELA